MKSHDSTDDKSLLLSNTGQLIQSNKVSSPRNIFPSQTMQDCRNSHADPDNPIFSLVTSVHM